MDLTRWWPESTRPGPVDLSTYAPRILPRLLGYVICGTQLAGGVCAAPQATITRVLGPQGFGLSVSAIGDIDSDGFAEIVATLPWDSAAAPQVGLVTVASGRTGAVLRTIRGPVANSYFGWRTCDLGDVDGDRVPDFAFSAGNSFAPISSPGVRVVSGRTLQELVTINMFGYSLLGKIDVDGDGVRDLIGAWPNVGRYNGSVHAYSVRTRQFLWVSEAIYDNIGFVMHAVPDRDGDGVDDILASKGPSGGIPTGAVFLSGRTGRLMGGGWGDPAFGLAVLPDMDGDGRPDYATGGANGGPGSVRILSSNGGTLLHVPAPVPETGFGNLISRFMDYDEDGKPDILVASGDQFGRPRLHIVSGRDGRILRTIDGLASSAFNSDGLLGADINGDSFSDIVTAESPAAVVVLASVRGSYGHFGVGCRGSFGDLTLRGQAPALGQSFSAVLSNVAPLWGGVMYFGASDRRWGTVPLPTPLDQIGMNGCTLYVSGDVALPWLPVSSVHPFVTPIPADPAMLNVRFFNQAFQLDIRANPLGMVGTNAGVGVIGT